LGVISDVADVPATVRSVRDIRVVQGSVRDHTYRGVESLLAQIMQGAR
jgi:hypothetical protein